MGSKTLNFKALHAVIFTKPCNKLYEYKVWTSELINDFLNQA